MQSDASEVSVVSTKLASPARFALSFFAIGAVLFAVYTFPYRENGISEQFFDRYLAFYARIAGTTLSLIEPNITVNGADISGRFALRIVKNCDAMEINILFLAAVLAFPVPWVRRLTGVCIGLPVLVTLNVIRICSLYYIGIYAPKSFETYHMEIWPLVLVAATTVLFIGYVNWAQGARVES